MSEGRAIETTRNIQKTKGEIMLELTIIGNLGEDPEARYTPDGVLVCNFDVAATRKLNGKDETVWVEVAAWRELGERCHRYLTKGQKVFVRGYPEVRSFTRKNGEAGTALRVTAQTVQFLSGKRGDIAADENTDRDEIPF
ncbi:MAG: single-stranded DNA-binding protein [Anaerolineales bacterium]